MHRVGLLGGTFDPVHNGHIQLARAAIEEASLEKVVMIPASGPPHKDYTEITPFHHRLEMLRLAVSNEPCIEFSAVEGDLPKPSYTVDTVRFLRTRAEAGTLFHFIIGIDAFVDILSWKSWHELLGMVVLLVARRKGFEDEQGLGQVREVLGYTQSGNIWKACDPALKDIRFLKSDIRELSSSAVRTFLEKPNSEVSGLAVDVEKYIRENSLYLPQGGDRKASQGQF